MTLPSFLRKYPGLPPYLLMLALFLGVNAAVVVSDQRSRLSDTYHTHMREEIELMGLVVREAVIKHDLATVEEFLVEWGKRRNDIIGIKATAASGFVLVDYSRSRPFRQFMTHHETVAYRNETLLELEIRHDLERIERATRDMSWRLGALSTLLAVILGAGLWWVLRRTAVIPLEREVTERKKNEQTIAHLMKQNEMILGAAGDGIYGLDLEGRTTFANPATTRMISWEAHEIIGKPQHDILHHTRPDGTPYPREECHIYAVLKDGKTRRVDDEVFWRKDGSSFPVEYVSTPIMEDGKTVGAVVAFRDISDRKAAEVALRESEERFRGYFELGLVGMALTSLEKGWVQVNDKLCEIFGYPREELIKLSWAEITHPDDIEADVAQFNRVLAGEIEGYSMDKRFIRKDGDVIHASISTKCIRRDDGSADHFVAFVQDITERKQSEEKINRSKEELERNVIELNASRDDLEQQAAQLVELAEEEAVISEKLKYEVGVKNRFFSIISHDLKSPFTSLLGMTQMMSQMADGFSKDKLVEYATNVNEAGDRVFELLQNLLEWSRLQMEGAKLEPESVSLQKLAQESIDILNPIALEKDIQLTNKIKKTTVFADRDMAQTVIRNLIANAIKFTPSGGKVEASSNKDEGMVQITVADTGVGMTAKHAEEVFALDQKTSTTGTAGETGTGLGLPLCKEMVERNGGRIWVESAPGEGSRFHFTLPTEASGE